MRGDMAATAADTATVQTYRAHANEGMKAFGMPDVVIDGQVLKRIISLL